MTTRFASVGLVVTAVAWQTASSGPGEPPNLHSLSPNTWHKLSPLPGGPPSPRLGYEGACAWDSKHHVLIRSGGHNQGGGGEQHAEVWTFDPRTGAWTLQEPNTSPPGNCCGQQNVFDPVRGRYVRFPAFSGSHGWQWSREIYLNDSSVWTYDLADNTWRNLRPLPGPQPRPLRCASWDAEHEVIVLFGGEGSHDGTWVYDPATNTWTAMKPPREPESRSGGNMTYDAARRLHVLFGAQFSNDPSTWVYDLRRNEWQARRPMPAPHSDKNDAVLTYDAGHRAVLAIVKITEGKDEDASHRLETWCYDTGADRWRKLDPREPDASGNRARGLMFAPEYQVALLENRPHPPRGPHEQQVWAYRLAGTPEPASVLPPQNVRVTTQPGRATVAWDPSSSAGVTHYVVRRGVGSSSWLAVFEPVARIDAKQREYIDEKLTAGSVYFYRVQAVGPAGQSSEPSRLGRAQPPLVEDVACAVQAADRIELRWRPTAASDCVGYHIERAAVEVWSEDQLRRLKSRTPPLAEPSAGAIRRIGQFRRITATPVAGPVFCDLTVDLNRPADDWGEIVHARRLDGESRDSSGKPYRYAVYAYRVRAVNALGMDGGPSAPAFTLPAAPQWVFAREDGTTCQLKWSRASDEAIAGYRIYRMDGRYDREPITRLTPDPIAAATFADPAAGKSSRRYYIVAVDPLGQEGFPSSPVWFNREWRPFYAPFTGMWHQ
jgi:hypothetical protein